LSKLVLTLHKSFTGSFGFALHIILASQVLSKLNHANLSELDTHLHQEVPRLAHFPTTHQIGDETGIKGGQTKAQRQDNFMVITLINRNSIHLKTKTVNWFR
jgi:hypothetical protein